MTYQVEPDSVWFNCPAIKTAVLTKKLTMLSSPYITKALNSYSATKLIQLGQEHIQLQHQVVRVIPPPFCKKPQQKHQLPCSVIILIIQLRQKEN